MLSFSFMGSDNILRLFEYASLPESAQRVSAPFGELAKDIVASLPNNAERTNSLCKLLEAKDHAVSALLSCKEHTVYGIR